MIYNLPSHPTIRCLDPLSITDKDEPTAWDVIEAAIQNFQASIRSKQSLAGMHEFIETISYSLHGISHVDTQFLQKTLRTQFDAAQSLSLLDRILESALSLPNCFPSHEIQHLTPTSPHLELSMQQLKALVAHQFIGTLTCPVGNSWGCNLAQWYSEPQALPQAVHGYLLTTLHLFEEEMLPPVSYDLCANSIETNTRDSGGTCQARAFDHLEIEPVTSQTVPFPHERLSCTLIASNKEPGFGSSCTQEELITGACPSLLPLGAVLLAPPIPDDGILLVRGAAPLSLWQGQGREANLMRFLPSSGHTFLLMDALELDLQQGHTGLPDLRPHNLHRELNKAYTGFRALQCHGINAVSSPLWGAGAFSGDPVVKAFILTLAGAKAGVTIYLTVDSNRSYTHPSGNSSNLYELLRTMKRKYFEATVGHLWSLLNSDSPDALDRILEV